MIDKYKIAARIEIAGLDGFKGTMKAAQQKAIFGAYLFGRKTISIDASGQGRVHGTYSCAYGTDSAFFDISFQQIADDVNGVQAFGF